MASFWRRCFERPVTIQNYDFSELFNAASDVEALFWLHYGVELGLYPRPEAQVILESNRSRLVHALQAVQSGSVAELFPRALPTFLGDQSFESAFDIRYADSLASDLVSTVVFDMLFHEIARASHSPQISAFSDLMTFGSEDEWRDLMQQDANPQHVLLGHGEKIDVLSAGYFAALDHMSALEELLQYVADEISSDRPTLRDSQGDQTYFMVGSRIRSIHGWRVKLDDPSIRERFLGLTYKLQKQLASDSELISMGFDADCLSTIVKSLTRSWLGEDDFSQPIVSAA